SATLHRWTLRDGVKSDPRSPSLRDVRTTGNPSGARSAQDEVVRERASGEDRDPACRRAELSKKRFESTFERRPCSVLHRNGRRLLTTLGRCKENAVGADPSL